MAWGAVPHQAIIYGHDHAFRCIDAALDREVSIGNVEWNNLFFLSWPETLEASMVSWHSTSGKQIVWRQGCAGER